MTIAVLRAPPGLTHAFLPNGLRVGVGPAGLISCSADYVTALVNGGFAIPMPDFADEFAGADWTIPSVATVGMRYFRKNQGAGDATFVADAAGGQIQVSLTSASAKQEGAIYFGDQRQFDLTKGVFLEARVKLGTLPTSGSKFFLGLFGDYADGPDSITYSLNFAANGDGAILCEKDDNATDQSVASTVVATTAEWHILQIDALNPADIKFYIDGIRVLSTTTFNYAATGANAILQPYVGIYKASGTSVGTVQVDYLKVYAGR